MVPTEPEKRWTIWECDCGQINRATAPGLQAPCAICNHPATIDCVEVVPASTLQELRDKYEELRDVRFEEGCEECQEREDAANKALEELREGLQREIERLKDWRNEPAETRRVDAVYLRLEQLLPHSPDGREEGSSND